MDYEKTFENACLAVLFGGFALVGLNIFFLDNFDLFKISLVSIATPICLYFILAFGYMVYSYSIFLMGINFSVIDAQNQKDNQYKVLLSGLVMMFVGLTILMFSTHYMDASIKSLLSAI